MPIKYCEYNVSIIAYILVTFMLSKMRVIIDNSSHKILADMITIFFCNILLLYTIHGNYGISCSSNELYYRLLDKVLVKRDPFKHIIRKSYFANSRRKQNPNIMPNRFVQKINKIQELKRLLFQKLESNEKNFYLAKTFELLKSTSYKTTAHTTPNPYMNHAEKMFKKKTNKIHKIRNRIFKKLEDNEKKYYVKKMLEFTEHTSAHAVVYRYHFQAN